MGVTGLHNSYPRVLASLEFGSEEYVFKRICPFCTKRSGDLEIFRYVAVVAGLNAIFA